MKKILFVLLVTTLLLTACSSRPLQSLNNMLDSSEAARIKQMSTDILTCISENDKESFKKLFSEQVQNSPDFDAQVDKAFAYCKGTVYFTDSTIKTRAGGGYSTDHGIRTQWHVYPEIPYFKVATDMDSGEKKFFYYSIDYLWYITEETDKTEEGIHYLCLTMLNVDSILIGE